MSQKRWARSARPFGNGQSPDPRRRQHGVPGNVFIVIPNEPSPQCRQIGRHHQQDQQADRHGGRRRQPDFSDNWPAALPQDRPTGLLIGGCLRGGHPISRKSTAGNVGGCSQPRSRQCKPHLLADGPPALRLCRSFLMAKVCSTRLAICNFLLLG